eukprot:NODE_130_length_18488_cov_0.389961.p1 type:complete len:846 gc:universal NODE_130_length_18488_cov_0.389961:7015-9552(+)
MQIFTSLLLAQSDSQVPSNINSLSLKDLQNQFKKVSYPPDDQPSINGLRCTMPGNKAFTTKPGYFQMIQTAQPVACTAGFWCPGDTSQPFYCCPGFYCDTPDTILICPSGYYCSMGSKKPERCWFLAICPIGTSKPFRIGMLGVIVATLVIVAMCFSIKSRLDIQQAVRNRLQVEMIKQNKFKEVITVPQITNNKAIDIEFDNLEYKLPDGSVIMQNVSGFFTAGKMSAIMGPSGAGKTTLFSLLTGKAKKSRGSILLNGKKEDLSKYQKLVGYVPQEDIMLRELTVDNILSHSANMRLPSSLSSAQKRKKVVETIEFLGLGNVINTVIGDEETRGISGGQRKRVNIGMEIVSDPSVLFLDEPTSGLDSSTALELCQILSKLAKQNKMTIAAIIHSPSPQTFFEFHDVVLLGKGGKVVYFGPTKGVSHYFKELGFVSPKGMNPADFAMDIISGKLPCSWDSDFRPADLFDYWVCYQNGTPINKIRNDENAMKMRTMRRRKLQNKSMITRIVSSFFSMTLDLFEWTSDVITEFVSSLIEIVRIFTFMKDPVRSTPNFFVVYFLLLKRSFQQQFRSSKRFIFDSIIHFVAGLIVSVAIQDFKYLGKQPSQVCDISPFMLRLACNNAIDFINQAGMLVCVGILFAGQATSAHTFGNEKVVYWRDTSAGMHTVPYFLAKFTSDIPRIVIAGFFYTLSLTVFFDYRSQFFSLMLVNLSLYFVAFNFGYILSILFSKTSVGLLTAANALLWGFLFGGVSPDLTDVNDPTSVYAPFKIIWQFSAPRWAVEAFYIKEVGAREWAEITNLSIPFNHTYDRNNFGLDLLMMVLIGCMWAFFSFLALKLTNRRKQK